MFRQKDLAGFTLVEMAVAVALLGIIAVTISSRWFSTESFHGDSLQAQLLSEARLAQRTALANSQNDVALVLSANAGEWRYQIFEDDGGGRTLFREISASAGGINIVVTAGAAQSLGPGVNLDLTFDGLGNLDTLLIGGVAQDVSRGIQFDLSGARLCLSPLGYAHEGDCV
jgi:prepilin-type N-terminal cleavage/methylation domain-containing protein